MVLVLWMKLVHYKGLCLNRAIATWVKLILRCSLYTEYRPWLVKIELDRFLLHRESQDFIITLFSKVEEK